MRAAVITRSGGPEVLEIVDAPAPEPRAGEVLVRVRASALNRADVLQRLGRYPAPSDAPAHIPGLEIAGEVADLGGDSRFQSAAGAAPDVPRWRIGDRVFGIVAGGGNAEYVVSGAGQLARVPDGLSWEEAGAVPEAFITAHDALITQAAMRAGERVLVHAIGSGVGAAAVQLVRAFGGVCYGTARTPEKLERARELGMVGGVAAPGPEGLVGAVEQWTSRTGVNVVLDLVGGPYLSASLKCCAPLARIILIGLLAGRAAELDLGLLLNKRITLRGTVLRTRSSGEKTAATQAFVRDVLPLLDTGAVRPIVDRVFPLDRIREAHALMESNVTFGKIVLTV